MCEGEGGGDIFDNVQQVCVDVGRGGYLCQCAASVCRCGGEGGLISLSMCSRCV